jgi:hypothetical protein
MNNTMIKARLMPAIIEPMMVNQFFDDGGSFMAGYKVWLV